MLFFCPFYVLASSNRVKGGKPVKREMQLEQLMEEYGTQLLRMCTVYLHDCDLAQDAVQETFLKAYRHMSAFRGECSEK